MLRDTIRWKDALFGAAAFGAAHIIEVQWWDVIGHGQRLAWFVSTPRSMAFMAACMAVASATIGARRRGADSIISALAFILGAAFTSAIALFMAADGPGNLFPIALMVGTAVIGLGTAAGVVVGMGLRHLVR